jgi:hypothetical protein
MAEHNTPKDQANRSATSVSISRHQHGMFAQRLCNRALCIHATPQQLHKTAIIQYVTAATSNQMKTLTDYTQAQLCHASRMLKS